MGLFDSIIKDIANGEFDKKLEKFADKVEQLSGAVDESMKKLADKPDRLSQKANKLAEHGKKTIDIITE